MYSVNDCGTTNTIEQPVTKSNAKSLIGRFYINKKGDLVRVTKHSHKDLIGYTIRMRSIVECLIEDPEQMSCKVCAGKTAIDKGMAPTASTFKDTDDL